MVHFGKILFISGLLIALVGVVILITNRFGLHFGKLPGDILFKKGHVTIYIPIVTSIIFSIVISFLIWLVRK